MNFVRISKSFTEFISESSSTKLPALLQQYLYLRQSQGSTRICVFGFKTFPEAVETIASESNVELPEDRTLIDLLLPMESMILNKDRSSMSKVAQNPCPTPALFIVDAETSNPSFWSLNPDADIEEKAKKVKSAPLIGALVDKRYRIIRYISNGSFKHGWLAIDTRNVDSLGRCARVFLSTMRALHDGGSHKETRREMRKRDACESFVT